ncbi:disease resistance protein RPP8-like [Magnolia sinica]|uniref:disease resistance protein RPP8-like n=1 Tax=Magnolia sinica TaxID=86752 RepID=UPI00265B2AD0|nr:disease resistance protein RPP8-like [Magnolia sinica]
MVAVEAVVLQLLLKVADPLIREVISLYEVDDKVELIVTQFTQMQCFLKEADAKQEGDERVKNWVLDVTDAAYVAEDLIDTFIFKVAPLKRTGFVGRITRKAFPGQGNVCPDNLEQFGRKIVEECCGLPLAIVVIGGLLSTKEEWQWENVRESITWQINEGQDKIYKILSLSFRDLPYQLKPCFLYLGKFPEDHEFRAKKLIQLWAAEGFLQQRGNETAEKVGQDFLNELIQRSIIQLAKRSSNGGIKSCRIHDLMRDLSISKAKEGMFIQVHHGNSNDPASRARRLVIHHNALSECTSLNSSTSHCRSVLIHNQGYDMLESKQDKLLYKGFKLLRVLDLDVEPVTDTLLKDSYVGVKMACASKGFPRLESLHLEKLGNLTWWTVEKGALPSLLHLQINSYHQLRMLPEGLQHVTTLKKLELLNMSREFNGRLREDKGKDWNIICHIPSIDIRK